MAYPRDEIQSSFASVEIECSSCHNVTEIEDVEFVVQYSGARPHGHRFLLPEGWTINPPEDGALCGVGLTCAECNERHIVVNFSSKPKRSKPKRARKRR